MRLFHIKFWRKKLTVYREFFPNILLTAKQLSYYTSVNNFDALELKFLSGISIKWFVIGLRLNMSHDDFTELMSKLEAALINDTRAHIQNSYNNCIIV